MPPLQKAGLAPSYFRLVLPYIKGLRGELAVHNKDFGGQKCFIWGMLATKSGFSLSDTLTPLFPLQVFWFLFFFEVLDSTTHRFCPKSLQAIEIDVLTPDACCSERGLKGLFSCLIFVYQTTFRELQLADLCDRFSRHVCCSNPMGSRTELFTHFDSWHFIA